MYKMKRVLRFIHNGNQCPWTDYAEMNARKTADENSFDYRVIDVSESKIHKTPLLSPFSLYLENRFITSAPLTSDVLFKIINGDNELRTLDTAEIPQKRGALDKIELLDNETINDQCRICLNGKNSPTKSEWYIRHSSQVIGCVGYSHGVPVVFIESMPENLIPYKGFGDNPNVLGITCIYNNAELDYRFELMEWYISYINKETPFQKIKVLSGEYSYYPNGGIRSFFLQFGFKVIEKVGDIPLYGIGIDSVFLLERQ